MASDINKPFSYIEWLESGTYNNTTNSDIFKQYRVYQSEWYLQKGATATDEQQLIVDSYINLLKEITLNYSTQEEKNFLTQINYEDKKELDIIVPFFVKKLKQVTQYIVNKRHEVKFSKIKNSFKGSEASVKKVIKDLIINKIRDPDFVEKYSTSKFPSLSAASRDISIDIESLYDEYQHYFDVKGDVDKENYVNSNDTTRNTTFDSNTLTVDLNIWLDFNNAVNNLFSQIPLIISTNKTQITTDTNTNVSLNIFRADINDLDVRFFIDSSKTSSSIVTNLQKQLIEKYSGTSMYYLSTGSTSTSYVSGVLFEPKLPNSNILNRYSSSRATVPSETNLVSIKDIGGFFTPNKEGILNLTTFESFYEINPAVLDANTVYVFPDPTIYGIGRGNTKSDHDRVLNHTDVVSKLKAPRTNTQQYGDIVNTDNVQSFYPYQSTEETLKQHTTGISRSYDNVNFWSGEKGDVWSNADVYPVRNLTDLDTSKKQADLLVSDNVVHVWRTDIYGNEFALFKDTHPKSLTSQQQLQQYTTSAIQNIDTITPTTDQFSVPATKFYNYQLSQFTTVYQNVTSSRAIADSIYERTVKSATQFHFRNSYSNLIAPVSSVLSGVYIKYTGTHILDEINSNVISFDVIKDTILIETNNYLVIEQYKYDLTDNTFSSILPKRIYLSTLNKNSSLEKNSNIWYDEKSSNIFIAQTTLHPHLSASNFKIIYPTIYRYSLTDNNIYESFSVNTLLPGASSDIDSNSRAVYSVLSGAGFVVSSISQSNPIEKNIYVNITDVDIPTICLNVENDTFTVTFFARDAVDTTYLYNLYFDATDRSNFSIKQLDFFVPNTDCFNHNIANYVETATERSLSGTTDGVLRRGIHEKFPISYESFKARVIAIEDEATYDLVFNSTLSGRSINPTHSFDHNRGVIRMGVGVSATNLVEIPNTPLAPYSHNTSYILYNLPLSGTNTDIAVTFDIALYTLTSTNSSYAQINIT